MKLGNGNGNDALPRLIILSTTNSHNIKNEQEITLTSSPTHTETTNPTRNSNTTDLAIEAMAFHKLQTSLNNKNWFRWSDGRDGSGERHKKFCSFYTALGIRPAELQPAGPTSRLVMWPDPTWWGRPQKPDPGSQGRISGIFREKRDQDLLLGGWHGIPAHIWQQLLLILITYILYPKFHQLARNPLFRPPVQHLIFSFNFFQFLFWWHLLSCWGVDLLLRKQRKPNLCTFLFLFSSYDREFLSNW